MRIYGVSFSVGVILKINRAFKTELEPNNKQRGDFLRSAGTARFVYISILDNKAIL